MKRADGEQAVEGPAVLSRTQLARATTVVALATLASRALGFGRDTVFAYFFGATGQTDAYFAASVIPLVLFVGFREALVTVFIPVFTSTLRNMGREAAERLACDSLYVLTTLMAALTLVAVVAAPWIVRAIVPGFAPAELREAVLLTRIALPSLMFLTWAAWLTGVLNALQHFSAPALTGLPQNLVTIGFIVIGGMFSQIRWAAWGIVVGTMATVVIQWPPLRALGFRLRAGIDLNSAPLRQMARLATPIMIASLASQAGPVVDRILASHLPSGVLTDFAYAARLNSIAYSIFGLAIATVLYPSLATHAGGGDLKRFKDAVGRGIGLLNFVTTPIMAAMVIFRVALVRIAFQHGAFTAPDTSATAFALLYFSMGILSFAWLDLFNRSFYALQQTRTPMVGGILAVAVNVLLDFILVGPLRQGGLALATSVSWTVGVVFLAVTLRRRVGPLGGRRLVWALTRMAAAAVVSVGLAHVAFQALLLRLGHPRVLVEAGLLLGLGAAALLLYLGLCALLRLHEAGYARDLAAAAWRRLRPRPAAP